MTFPNHVYKLKKCIYGLKQASRAWHQKIKAFLQLIGFRAINADCDVYVKMAANSFPILAMFVDDSLMFGNDIQLIEDTKLLIGNEFEITDLKEAKTFLGIEISRDRVKGTIRLTQQKYANKLLEDFKMLDCKGKATPMALEVKLSKQDSPSNEQELSMMKVIPYQNLIGSLMYLTTCTRPDLAFSVYALAQFSSNPGLYHWKLAKRILQYLKTT